MTSPADAEVSQAHARQRWERAGLSLVRAEQEIALVTRARPLEPPLAQAKTRAGRGPEGCRAERIELGATRRLLEALAAETSRWGTLGEFHAGRARELELEARIVENLGRPAVKRLSAQRFPIPGAKLARRCEDFVRDALARPLRAAGRLHQSDDEGDPASLLCRLRRRAGELGLCVRVEMRAEQLATAATGEGVVAIRPRTWLTADAGRRIAEHELLGHALPRARARLAPLSLFRAGTAGASDEEEGRALLIEARSGLLDDARRRELAFRHRAALAVRDGAEPPETVALLLELGAEREVALGVSRRAHRGGGLAREIVYLPAYFAVADAFASEPGLEAWLERGRLDLTAARWFETHGLLGRDAAALRGARAPRSCG